MKEKIATLHTEIEKHLHPTGEIIEWDRSQNPPGEVLRIIKHGFRFTILDSALEDNPINEIIENVATFTKHIEKCKEHWLLNSRLITAADRS
jgi:hypothetical protein